MKEDKNLEQNLDKSNEITHIRCIPSFRIRYFFDGVFWYKDEGKGIEMLNDDKEFEIMKKNTAEGQWSFGGLDGKFIICYV